MLKLNTQKTIRNVENSFLKNYMSGLTTSWSKKAHDIVDSLIEKRAHDIVD